MSMQTSERPHTTTAPPVARRITPSQAVLAHPRLALLPVFLLLVPALALALLREPVYTAEARLLIGGFDVRSQAVSGYIEATKTLAETYSRLVSTRVIHEPVAEILGEPVERIAGKISASPIPESSLIVVRGSSTDEGEAERLSAAAAQALVTYATQADQTATVDSILDEFRAASLALNTAQSQLERLSAQYDARVSAGVATANDAEAVAAAEADIDRAQLERDTLAEVYRNERGAGNTSANMDLVAPATISGTDRRETLQVAIAGPLILGAIAGVALATLAANGRPGSGTAAGRRSR